MVRAGSAEEVAKVFEVEGRFMIVARETETGDVAGFVDITKEAFRHWDEEDDKYYLDWSQSRGTVVPLTQADMLAIEGKLPVMPDEASQSSPLRFVHWPSALLKQRAKLKS